MVEFSVVCRGGRYGVTIGDGVLARLPEAVAGSSSVVVVSDDRVGPLHGRSACEPLERLGIPVLDWVVPAGEASKSLWQSECLFDYLASKRVDRLAAVVALGGGVVGDLAGFVASTWMRGVRFINCPTSLLAAVDASVGGKNGLNHLDRKNLIGTFHSPAAVLIDTRVLATLPDDALRPGLAESIKHAVLDGEPFFNWHEAHLQAILRRDPAALETLIERNLRIKARHVECDERDQTGERAKLNFGHTIGHALETASTYNLTHGEAVAVGMVAEARMAVLLHQAEPGLVTRLERLLSAAGLPVRVPLPASADQILHLIQFDKKSAAGEARFVLARDLGQVSAGWSVPPDVVHAALAHIAC